MISRYSRTALVVLAALTLAACSRERTASAAAIGPPRFCMRESPAIPFVVGDTATLEVGPIDKSDSACSVTATNTKWKSSNPQVISVDARGFASAVAPGRATISVAGNDARGASVTDSAGFVVVPAIRDLRIVPDSVTLSIGDSAVFHITAVGQVPSVPVWWYSGDAAVSFARPGRGAAPASVTAEVVTVWAAQPGTALLEAGTRYLRDAAHVRVVVR